MLDIIRHYPFIFATIVVALVLAVAGHALLRWSLHRRARRDEDSAARLPTPGNRRRVLFSRSLRDGLPPFALLIWVHVICGALWLVAARLPQRVLGNGRLVDVVAWLYATGVTAAIVWLCWRAGVIVQMFLVSRARQSRSTWDTVMVPVAARAVRRLLPLVALMAGVSLMHWPPAVQQALRSLSVVIVIVVAAWLSFQATGAGAALVLRRHRVDVADNLHARSVHTQVLVLKKVLNALIAVFAFASILMSFDAARQLGASILASAGIAGIIVGLAAQRSISALLAGFQIALTQPIRVDDVVIVESEWGRVETITLTFVVVRIWDERRLVVPMNYFLEKPFQNWTRSSAELLGTVFLQVDFTVPIDALRAELTRILDQSPHWDGRVNALQVTDVKEHTIEVRALASAADASRAWDLRCEIREKLVTYLQRSHPESLPRVRAALNIASRRAERAPA